MQRAVNLPTMSDQEFLDWHEEQEERYELHDGVVVKLMKSEMMAGAKRTHNLVVVNLTDALRNRLRGTSCIPFTSDMAVRLNSGRIFYPDVVVDCGEGAPDDQAAADPRVVVEVLSRSTRYFDLTTKVAQYREVESIRAILLVSTETTQVELHERAADGAWAQRRIAEPDADVRLDCLDVTLTMAAIYERLDLPPPSQLGVVHT